MRIAFFSTTNPYIAAMALGNVHTAGHEADGATEGAVAPFVAATDCFGFRWGDPRAFVGYAEDEYWSSNTYKVYDLSRSGVGATYGCISGSRRSLVQATRTIDGWEVLLVQDPAASRMYLDCFLEAAERGGCTVNWLSEEAE